MERRMIALGATLTVLSLSAAPAGAQVAVPPVDPAALLPTASTCQVSVLDADSVRVTGSVDRTPWPRPTASSTGCSGF